MESDRLFFCAAVRLALAARLSKALSYFEFTSEATIVLADNVITTRKMYRRVQRNDENAKMPLWLPISLTEAEASRKRSFELID